ncbi:anthrone oxygenase family protein [Bradyrhizobium sp. AS23.2]|uniref:anthrone oxygenase family protein n=1 Tax=Bradyrhizobium sp. AS23.2 TaxID=1680155 RepID=UPI00093DBFD5|nr:anthrone oxygenase family protein [Bradyrhizobium sp. AS23.2]OKO71895.1 membrane protein [Bradyrhizobium sp. AS23.2]
MRQVFATGLLWFSAIGCGLMAGIYFAFSTFIMTALSRLDQAEGIAAMNAIIVDIVRSLFMPLFLGTTVAGAALVVMGALRVSEPGAVSTIAGGGLYVIGMFVVTMVFNVPLNNTLAAVGPSASEAASVWAAYLKDWTFWNHVRTVASAVACALFVAALAS